MSFAVTPARPMPPTRCWLCTTPLHYIGAAVRWIAGFGVECGYCAAFMDVPAADLDRAGYNAFRIRAARKRAELVPLGPVIPQ